MVGLPAALGLFSGSYRRTFDAWVHIFLADHYLRSWFDPWEPRWYGGFSTLSYPPLAHQLVALAARLVGLEQGFVVVMAVALLSLPFAAMSFSRALLGRQYDAWVLMTVALWPTAQRFGHVYGQLPTLLATPLALWAMAALCRFLDEGRWLDWAQMAALVGATAATHHVSTIFVAAGCGIVGLDRLVLGGRAGLMKTLWRGALAALAAAAAIGLTIYPFWQFAAALPQAEIPHISREPLWQRPLSPDVVEEVVILCVGLAGLVVAGLRWRKGLGLVSGVTFFALLSMGFSTPLPRLLFGAQSRWLTYDKFHHWSAVWCAVVVAVACSKLGRKAALPLALFLLPQTLYAISHKQAEAFQPPWVQPLEPMTAVLKGQEAARYRHLTLGFGDQFCRLDVSGDSPNVDGDYHTARNDPLLRSSGVATLDASKYYPRGREVLDDTLRRADALSLRWVFARDGWYFEPLLAAGFEVRDVYESGVTLFERPGVPPLPPAPKHPEVERWGLFWGLVPLLVLGLALGLSAVNLAVRRGLRRSA
jgi:hypothetical protein